MLASFFNMIFGKRVLENADDELPEQANERPNKRARTMPTSTPQTPQTPQIPQAPPTLGTFHRLVINTPQRTTRTPFAYKHHARNSGRNSGMFRTPNSQHKLETYTPLTAPSYFSSAFAPDFSFAQSSQFSVPPLTPESANDNTWFSPRQTNRANLNRTTFSTPISHTQNRHERATPPQTPPQLRQTTHLTNFVGEDGVFPQILPSVDIDDDPEIPTTEDYEFNIEQQKKVVELGRFVQHDTKTFLETSKAFPLRKPTSAGTRCESVEAQIQYKQHEGNLVFAQLQTKLEHTAKELHRLSTLSLEMSSYQPTTYTKSTLGFTLSAARAAFVQVSDHVEKISRDVDNLEAKHDRLRLEVEKQSAITVNSQERPPPALLESFRYDDSRIKYQAEELQMRCVDLLEELDLVTVRWSEIEEIGKKCPIEKDRINCKTISELMLRTLAELRIGVEQKQNQCQIKISSPMVLRVIAEVEAKWNQEMDSRRKNIEYTTHERQLTVDEERLIEKAFNEGQESDILCSFFNVKLRRDKFSCLRVREWLESDVVNMFLSALDMYIKAESANEDSVHKCHIFSSFFFTRLTENGFNFSAVQRWTRKVDIFANDLIIVPVHLGNHWTLAVVNINEQSIDYYDSLGGEHNSGMEHLKQYLRLEQSDKNRTKTPTCPTTWRTRNLDSPQQDNGSDCGVFMLKNAEYLCRKRPLLFGPPNMKFFRNHIALTVLQGKFNPVHPKTE